MRPLREAIAAKFQRENNTDVNLHDTIVYSGGKQVIIPALAATMDADVGFQDDPRQFGGGDKGTHQVAHPEFPVQSDRRKLQSRRTSGAGRRAIGAPEPIDFIRPHL